MTSSDSISPTAKSPKMPRTTVNQLEALKQVTMVVADTGDYGKIRQYAPQDATTNPSLVFQAVQSGDYNHLVREIVDQSGDASSDIDTKVSDICERLAVRFGVEILKVIPGRVSTEVDACLSFCTHSMIAQAQRLIALYESHGVDRDRVLIKIASTWEGVQACRALEEMGIHTNMTLIFNYEQAIACAQAGATLISPFVGRILDWFNKNSPTKESYTNLSDPGVVSVTRIYKYFKSHNHKTIVMGASFRNKSQILGLAGIDALTISPKLLHELEQSTDALDRVLTPELVESDIPKIVVDEETFRWALNEDAMATEKLAEGIRNFNADMKKLKSIIRSMI